MKTAEILQAIAERKPSADLKRKATAQRPNWFRFDNSAEEKTLTLFLYDAIGIWFLDTDSKTFATTLSAFNGDKIVVRINSPGGSVFEGFAIYNLLREHAAQVHVKIDGVAASIASVIAMAGDEIEIADNAQIMIHNPSAVAYGESKDLRATADVLDSLREGILSAYARTSIPKKDLEAQMDAETWFNADDSIAKGLATKKAKPVKATALWSPDEFAELPEAARALCYRDLTRPTEKDEPQPPPSQDPVQKPSNAEQAPAFVGSIEDVAAASDFIAAIHLTLQDDDAI